MTPVLQLDGLSAGYGSMVVVRDVQLSVDEGEIVALVGANGAGKTTTLLALSGLIARMSGSVTVAGTPVASGAPAAARRAGLALVPDDRALFASLSAREHLALVAGADRQRSVEDAVEWFPNLARVLDRPVGLLSGGEQQMVALARGLAAKPKVLVIDELSMGLAPTVVRSLLDTLRRIASTSACGVLLVEQHVRLARTAADRTFVMRRGEVAAVASDSAEDEFAAEYFGHSVG